MKKSFRAIAALIAFIFVYFLVSTIIFLIVLYLNGGSVFSLSGWRSLGLATFANAWAGYLGVAAGLAFIDAFLTPYPSRFIGITFITLLGLWFIPLTLIYVIGAISLFVDDGNLSDWPPKGEFTEYFLGLVRAVVAVICSWVMLLKRHT